MRHRQAAMLACLCLALLPPGGFAAERAHELPELLLTRAGDTVETAHEWATVRRPELLALFAEHIYGETPAGRPADLSFAVTSTDPDALEGKATLKEVAITFSGPGGEGRIRPVVYLPNDADGAVPAFLLINHRQANGFGGGYWSPELIVSRGYAAIRFDVADVDADRKDGFDNGVHALFDRHEGERPGDAWGTFGAWAWGASRVLDHLETDPAIDAQRVAVVGHSRSGKTALWCGAQDERFALTISNESGAGGAAMIRPIAAHQGGQGFGGMCTKYSYWFCGNFRRYEQDFSDLPVDQHMLVALMAPRLVYVASAIDDRWTWPEAEFLACRHAAPAWELLGQQGFAATDLPALDTPVHDGRVGYHVRRGGHGLTAYDWNRFMDFADRHLRAKE